MPLSDPVALLADVPLPAALVDLDALDANLSRLGRAAGAVPIRVATKSVRCRVLLERARARWPVSGFMTVSPREALHLARHGFDELLTAYPVARAADARPLLALARDGVNAPIVVDCADHVALLAGLGRDAGVELPVVVDVDVSWRPLGQHLGVRRSPIRDAHSAVALADRVATTDGVRFCGIMAYEAAVAGLPDRTGSLTDPIRRRVKARSASLAATRRAEVVSALTEAGLLPALVNGGGTGSLDSTCVDPVVTEVTIGSGLLAPHQFDGYDDLDLAPAAFFAMPVARRSDPDHVTAHGGGYPASGPPGPSRSPLLHTNGLSPTASEGFGEVQTPFREARAGSTGLGDVLLARHTKAGELLERFSQIHLVRDGRIVGAATTYRGDGLDLG